MFISCAIFIPLLIYLLFLFYKFFSIRFSFRISKSFVSTSFFASMLFVFVILIFSQNTLFFDFANNSRFFHFISTSNPFSYFLDNRIATQSSIFLKAFDFQSFFFGHGINSWSIYSLDNLNTEDFSNAHNSFLHILFELGFFATFILFLLWIKIVLPWPGTNSSYFPVIFLFLSSLVHDVAFSFPILVTFALLFSSPKLISDK